MARVTFAVLLVTVPVGGDRERARPQPADTPAPGAAPAPAADPSGDMGDANQVFEKRIPPIFRSPDPSSCVQCHLAGVDLKHDIRPTHEETFLSPRDPGLIDLDAPAKSKILALIQMREPDKAGAALVHEKARKAEHAAFAAWITASAADPKLRAAPKLPATDLAGPKRPVEVIRHARTDRLEGGNARSREGPVLAQGGRRCRRPAGGGLEGRDRAGRSRRPGRGHVRLAGRVREGDGGGRRAGQKVARPAEEPGHGP